jgi:hypothetical protein
LSVWYIALIVSICLLGWIGGLITYAAIVYLIKKLLRRTMRLDMMKGMDELFFLDDYRNRGNNVAMQKYEKFDT